MISVRVCAAGTKKDLRCEPAGVEVIKSKLRDNIHNKQNPELNVKLAVVCLRARVTLCWDIYYKIFIYSLRFVCAASLFPVCVCVRDFVFVVVRGSYCRNVVADCVHIWLRC